MCQERAESSTRKTPEDRGKVVPEDKLPPGVSANFGYPEKSSPFVQVKLPAGMEYNGKKSRAVSFMDKEGHTLRGTVRTKDSAISCTTSWAWTWWNGLSESEKNAVHQAMKSKRSCSRERSASAKRAKK